MSSPISVDERKRLSAFFGWLMVELDSDDFSARDLAYAAVCDFLITFKSHRRAVLAIGDLIEEALESASDHMEWEDAE